MKSSRFFHASRSAIAQIKRENKNKIEDRNIKEAKGEEGRAEKKAKAV